MGAIVPRLDANDPLKDLHSRVNRFERSKTLKDSTNEIKKIGDAFKQLLTKWEEAQTNQVPYLKNRAVEKIKKDFKKKCEEFYEVNKKLPKTLDYIKSYDTTLNKLFEELRDQFEKNLEFRDVDYMQNTLAPRIKKIGEDLKKGVMDATDQALETASKIATKLGIPLEIAPAAPKKPEEKPWYELLYEYAKAEKGVAIGAALGMVPIFMRPSIVVQHPILSGGSTLGMFGAFLAAKASSQMAAIQQKEIAGYLSEAAKTFYVASCMWSDVLGGKFGYSAAHPAAAIAIGALQLGGLAAMTQNKKLAAVAGMGLTAAAGIGLGEPAGVAAGAATAGIVTANFINGLKEQKKENDKWVDTDKTRYQPYVGNLIGTAVASIGLASSAVTYFTKQAITDAIVSYPVQTTVLASTAALLAIDASRRGVRATTETMTGIKATAAAAAVTLATGSVFPAKTVFLGAGALTAVGVSALVSKKIKEKCFKILGTF